MTQLAGSRSDPACHLAERAPKSARPPPGRPPTSFIKSRRRMDLRGAGLCAVPNHSKLQVDMWRKRTGRPDVWFTPDSDRMADALPCPKGATSRHRLSYSITSSARASSVDGIVRPSAFAVWRLSANSNLIGFWTGRSAGCAPLRMRSTYDAARQFTSAVSTPSDARPPLVAKVRNG